MSSVPHGQEYESAATSAEQITSAPSPAPTIPTLAHAVLATASGSAIDGSVGSDNEALGGLDKQAADTAAVRDGAGTPQHVRSNSVKKPATFKAVSVTKNFLAKAGTPTQSSQKINGDSPAPGINGAVSTPAALRPRLVAKTASGLKPSKAAFTAQSGPAPDPVQVWNRNKTVVPAQPSKHLTDEELKQQYGIHLATRIQADADGKEAKWADIDDDDEDWAPDTIEWNDGTKIDLAEMEAKQAAEAAEKKAVDEALERERREEAERKAKALRAAQAARQTSNVGPNATILKPRSAAGQQAKPGTPVKTDTKPALVSKPSQPSPTKSPWAAIPSADKVSPVEIRPDYPSSPATAHARMYSYQRDAQAYSNQPPPQQPTMEIAADSFQRGRRNSQRDNVGQLYNAQSGNFEPANSARRGSMRKDGNFRPPSLLQRGGNQGGQESQGWDRRKPSNVSTDNSSPGRRQSMNKGSALEREGSHQSQNTQSPALSHASLATGRDPNAPPGVNAHGDYQKQLMRERMEQAKKRRAEEEAREAAERQERIRKKMESLGLGSADKKGASQADAGKNEGSTKSVSTKQPTEEAPVITAKSPPKPPAPNASGIPQQYGMMKLHSTVTREPQTHSDAEKVKAKHETSRGTASTATSSIPVAKAEADKRAASSLVNGGLVSGASEVHFPRTPENQAASATREIRSNPWNSIANETIPSAGWPSQAASKEPSSVWGHASASRALGNGIFDPTIQRPGSRHQDQQSSSALPPIGTPKHLLQSNAKSAQLSFDDLQPGAAYPPGYNDTQQQLDSRNRMVNGENKSSIPFTSGTQHSSQRWDPLSGMSVKDKTQAALAAWNNFPATAARDEAEEMRRWQLEREAQQGEPVLPTVNETWQQIKVDDSGLGRAHGAAPGEMRSVSFVNSVDAAAAASGSLGRGSRFFPMSAGRPHAFQQQQQPFSPFYRRGDSPPPPDETGHPAFDKQAVPVTVRLPPGAIKPRVRLPPSAAGGESMAAFAADPVASLPLRAVSQPLVNNPSWQDRFNGLLGLKKANLQDDHRPAPAMPLSATKEPLDLARVRVQASVTLPPNEGPSFLKGMQTMFKNYEDEEILFEPESGSTPTVLFPPRGSITKTPLDLNGGANNSQARGKEVVSVTKDNILPPDVFTSQSTVLVVVNLAGMSTTKSKPMKLPNGYTKPAGSQQEHHSGPRSHKHSVMKHVASIPAKIKASAKMIKGHSATSTGAASS